MIVAINRVRSWNRSRNIQQVGSTLGPRAVVFGREFGSRVFAVLPGAVGKSCCLEVGDAFGWGIIRRR